MNSDAMRLARLACRVHAIVQTDALQDVSELLPRLDWMTAELKPLRQQWKQLHRCVGRGWPLTGRRIYDQLDARIRRIESDCLGLRTMLDRRQPLALTARAVLDELIQIEHEFGEVHFDAEEVALVAVTDPIVLEGVPLGPFELRLLLKELNASEPVSALRIVALAPNPASRDHDVTHPHVKLERLCPGEASSPLHNALSQRRFCDVFLLARSVLQTYCAESPFVALEDWYGRSCHECGYSGGEDETSYCEGCEEDFCDECISGCRSCGSSQCSGCLSSCTACDESTCESCVEACTACQANCCPGCLDQGVCETCSSKKENDDDDHVNQTTTKDSPAKEQNQEPHHCGMSVLAGPRGSDADAALHT